MGTFVSKQAAERSLALLSPDHRAAIPTIFADALASSNHWLDYNLFVDYLRFFGSPDADRIRSLRAMGTAFIGASGQDNIPDALQALTERFTTLHRGNAGRFFVQQHGKTEWQVTAAIRYPYPFIEGMVQTALAVQPSVYCTLSAGTVTRRFATMLVSVQPDNVVALD